MTRASHVTADVTQEAVGALCAQRAIQDVRNSDPDVAHAWNAFVIIASKHGWRSPAAAAFIGQLAKLAAEAGA